jgi:hypothetical protein
MIFFQVHSVLSQDGLKTNVVPSLIQRANSAFLLVVMQETLITFILLLAQLSSLSGHHGHGWHCSSDIASFAWLSSHLIFMPVMVALSTILSDEIRLLSI